MSSNWLGQRQMVDSYINKDNYPFLVVDNGMEGFSQTPCDIATLRQNTDLLNFNVYNQEVKDSFGGFSSCDNSATRLCQGDDSHINKGFEGFATVATKSDNEPEPAQELIEGLLAEYGSVEGNTDKAKQVILGGIKADIKSEAQRQVELLGDDIYAQRQVLQSYTDRMIVVGDLILDKKDKLTLSQGRTPARRRRWAGVWQSSRAAWTRRD